MIKLLALLSMMIGMVHAHEMTPTYPTWKSSHVAGVSKTTMEMFNKREDVEYYEIGVFDKDFNPIPFVSSYKVAKIKYLGHLKLDIYINDSNIDTAVYICSRSKVRKEKQIRTAVSSRICSKFKE